MEQGRRQKEVREAAFHHVVCDHAPSHTDPRLNNNQTVCVHGRVYVCWQGPSQRWVDDKSINIQTPRSHMDTGTINNTSECIYRCMILSN